MKTCICVTGENSDSTMSSLSLSIDHNGINLGYDAYSTDSSFEDTIACSFCPFCGESLSTLSERRDAYLQQQAVIAQKSKSKVQKRLDREQEAIDEETLKIAAELAQRLNPSLYRLDDQYDVEAFSKREAKIRLREQYGITVSNNQMKTRLVCIREMSKKTNQSNPEFENLGVDEGTGSLCCGKRKVLAPSGLVYECLNCGSWEYSSS